MRILRCELQVIGSIIFCFGVCTANSGTTASSKNVPEEIVQLFNGKIEPEHSKNTTLPTDVAHNVDKIFTEGSTSYVNTTHNDATNTTSPLKGDSAQHMENSTNPQHHKTKLPDENGNIVPEQSNKTTLDFISGLGDMPHTNGMSSIKPRKGVSYSKIVPKKGVDINDYISSSLPTDHSCFYVNQNTCYNIDTYKDLNCTCCEISNNLGITVSTQPLINCSSCTPVNSHSQPCNGICCTNTTIPNIEIKTEKPASNNASENFDIVENHVNKTVKKLKPTVTNVPYDSDSTNPFNKSRGEKYVPIIVSIFILPLVGVFVFFIWKKTREVWDRRYYKRMDFLIDGMYNE